MATYIDKQIADKKKSQEDDEYNSIKAEQGEYAAAQFYQSIGRDLNDAEKSAIMSGDNEARNQEAMSQATDLMQPYMDVGADSIGQLRDEVSGGYNESGFSPGELNRESLGVGVDRSAYEQGTGVDKSAYMIDGSIDPNAYQMGAELDSSAYMQDQDLVARMRDAGKEGALYGMAGAGNLYGGDRFATMADIGARNEMNVMGYEQDLAQRYNQAELDYASTEQGLNRDFNNAELALAMSQQGLNRDFNTAEIEYDRYGNDLSRDLNSAEMQYASNERSYGAGVDQYNIGNNMSGYNNYMSTLNTIANPGAASQVASMGVNQSMAQGNQNLTNQSQYMNYDINQQNAANNAPSSGPSIGQQAVGMGLDYAFGRFG